MEQKQIGTYRQIEFLDGVMSRCPDTNPHQPLINNRNVVTGGMVLMFTQLAPQKVQHSSGFIVQTGSRYSLEYLDGNTVAEVEVDFAPVTAIYTDSVIIRTKNDISARPATPEEKVIIVSRIESALQFLGAKYELCKGRH